MGTFLLTRPKADSEKLAHLLQAQGHNSLISPVITITPLSVSLQASGMEGIILTSRHAVEAAKGLPQPCFVVGEQTAEAARAAGLSITAEAPDARSLDKLLPAARLLYLSGAHIRHSFSAPDRDIKRVVVYRAEAAAGLTPLAIQALANATLTAVVLYSPRSARLFSDFVEQSGISISALPHCCLSEAVAAECRLSSPAMLHIAGEPRQEAMLTLLNSMK